MDKSTQPVLVSIRCTVYNHAPYLRDCLDGFVKQKTNFRFEAVVHDDASTDGSAEIIKEYADKYPDIIKPILEVENQWSKHDGSIPRIMESNMSGKYIAICEGDDYWTDENKLQLQVDYMEQNEDCSLCFHDVDVLSMKDGKIIKKFALPDKDRNYTSKHLFTKGWFVATTSILYRRQSLLKSSDFPDWAKIEGMGSDIKWQMFLSAKGYFHFIARTMGVYRFGVPGSATDRARGNKSKGHVAYLQFLSNANKNLFGGKYTLYVWYNKARFFAKKLLS